MLSHGKCHRRLLQMSRKTCSLCYYITVFIVWFSWKLASFIIMFHQFPSVMGEYSVWKTFLKYIRKWAKRTVDFGDRITDVYMIWCRIYTQILYNIDICLIHAIIKKITLVSLTEPILLNKFQFSVLHIY